MKTNSINNHILGCIFFLFVSAAWSSQLDARLLLLSQEKVSNGENQVSVTVLDENTNVVVATHDLGVTGRDYEPVTLVDESGTVAYISLPGVGRDPWQLIVYSIENASVITRIPLARPNHSKEQFKTHHIFESDDGRRLFVVGPGKKKDWRLDVYSKPDYELRGSTELPRGVVDAQQVAGGYVAVLTSGELGKREQLIAVDTYSHEIAREYLFAKRSTVQLVRTESMHEVAVLVASRIYIHSDGFNRDVYGDIVFLHRFNLSSGVETGREQLGFDPTPVFFDDRNEFGYFATRRTWADQGVTLWKVNRGRAEVAAESRILESPAAVFVDESSAHAVVFYRSRALIFDLSTGELSHHMRLPFSSMSGFLNQDGSRLFFKELQGSEVGLLDINSRKVLADVSTGRTSKKVAQYSVSVAAAVLMAAYLPTTALIYPLAQTHMITDADESSLYVVNYSTGDVTILNAETLERHSEIQISKPIALWRDKQSAYILVVAEEEIMLIDSGTNEIRLHHEEGAFVGIDETNKKAYFVNQNGLVVIDAFSGVASDAIPGLSQVFQVHSSTGKMATLNYWNLWGQSKNQ